MDIKKMSEEERKKYIEGFKQYIANRNGSNNIQDNEMVNNIVDNAFNDIISNSTTRRDYRNNNTTWNRVQNIANNNLNRTNNMQNLLDRNTRNQMVKPLEDYTNTKRMAMQNVSNAIQENNNNGRYLPLVTQISNNNESEDINIASKKEREKLISSIKKQIGRSVGENILEFSNSLGNYNRGNKIEVYKNNLGQIDTTKTALEMGQKNFENEKKKLQMVQSKKTYEKAINEQLKNTLSYKEVERQNPNETEEELLKITKEKDKKALQDFIESLANMEPAKKNAMIEGFTHDKNQKYNLKSQVQAVETQREADKINEDIKNGDYWSSVWHVAEGVPEGAKNSVLKTAATLESLSNGKHYNTLINPNYDPVLESKLQTRKYQEITSKIDNGVVQTSSGISNTIGEMTPAMLTNVAAPGYGAIVNAANVGSSGYLEALNEDNSNKGQALLTGALKAITSYKIEKFAGGNFLSGGSLDDWAAKTIANKTAGITNKTANKVAQKIASKIYEVGGEVLEEELENQVDYLINAIINDKGITLKEWLNEQGETVKNTALTQLTLNLFGLGGDTYNKVNEYSLDSEAKKWVNEAQKIIDKENLQINTDKIKERELRNGLNQVNIKEDNQAKNNTTNLQQNLINNQINPLEQQINQPENKVAQNGNIAQISNYVSNNKKETHGKILYHGTNNNLEGDFNTNTGRKDYNSYGEATYLTENKDYAKKYGDNIYENTISKNANIVNIDEIVTISSDKLNDITSILNKNGIEATNNGEYIQTTNNGGIDPMNRNIYKQIIQLFKKQDSSKIKEVMIELGVDGISRGDVYAIYNPNVIENISNVANSQQTLYNNTESEGGINEGNVWEGFRRLQEEARSQLNRDSGERINAQNNEKLRRRLTNDLRGELEHRGYNASFDRRILLKSNKGIEFNMFDNIDANTFHDIFEVSKAYTKNGELVDLHNIEHYRNTKNYLSDDGMSGFAITENGDLISVFNTHGDNKKGFLSAISDIVKEKVKSLDCYVSEKQNLREIYEKKFGFKTASIMEYNIEYDHDNIAKNHNFPQVAFMVNTQSEVPTKYFSKDQYNDAIEYRNKFIDNGKELEKSSSFNLQTNNNQLKEVEVNTQSLGYKPDTEGKQRKYYKSVMESEQVGEIGKQSANSLLEKDTYKPISNIDTLATANENISRNGVDNIYIAFRNKMNSNERITLQDIATGERLIQIFSQNGDYEKVNGLIQDVAMIGTELGQNVQALSLIKTMSPEGQLIYLQKVVERTNIKENADLKVSNDMSRRILEAKNETELENIMTDIAVELGEKLPITMGDKVRSWRYLSMLGNPKTHIKNLGANVAMNITQQTKNKVAGAMEDVVGIFNKDLERTKTLRPANQDQKSFAKQDAEYMKDKIDGGGKYDIKNIIESYKRQFDNDTLNAIAEFNSDMLELEDNIFLKKAYQQAMQNYMSANKLSSSDMQNSNVLQKAREYASYQAQEATFHQFSELAKRLTEIENKGGIAGKTLEAVIPFKKTPINIAKSGIEYSPIGLAKSLTYDIVQLNKKAKDYKTKLEKGFISEAEYKTGTSQLVTKTIDDMAKGLTGTSLALLGYALKDMGILKAGNDGEDDEFREKLGDQEYAIKIGDNTYTLDWVSPSAIPMFMGATVHDLIHSEEEDNFNTLNSLMTSSAKALEPMTEMSMLQGLTSAISSYEQGSSNMLFDLGASAISSYMGQFVPTALGQVAKTIDDKERDTSSTKKGLAKKVDQFKKQQMAKIPLVSKMLPVRKDVWGNEKTRDSNVLVRAYEVGLAPYNRKKVVEDYTEKELLKVFENTGEKAVLPGIPNKDITINKQKYRLTAGEYNKAKETFGKTSKSMLDSLVKTKEYKNLTDEQKAEAINNIYSYAKEKIKVDYAKNKKQKVETTSTYDILKELKNPSNQSEYLTYSSKIKGIEKDKEKKQILSDANYSETTKVAIYKNTLGKKDELYNSILSKDNININEYLRYKLQEFESDKEDDGTEQGKSIKGSRPKKVYEYVNNMNITKQQKLAILGTQYKLSYKDERMELFNYINNISVDTKEDRLEIFRKYEKNFVIYKDGTMSLK